MKSNKISLIITFTVVLFLLSLSRILGQAKLDRKVSVKFRQKPLTEALVEIGHKGGFYFSYNTNIIKGDSLVSAEEKNKPIRQILDNLLGDRFDFLETNKYVIILQRTAATPFKIFTISGYVRDGRTKEKITDASVFESNQLVSALTDTSGYFRLRLKDRFSRAVIVVSKQLYDDTLLVVNGGSDQQFNLTITQARVSELSPFVVTNHVEKTWLGKLFLSSREIVQSMNLSDFFANKPVQFSLVPGLGTHGRMGGQVINKFSANMIGGYTTGTDGVELAGIFNIDKKEVRHVQAAGGFNIAGGMVTGVQLAGIHNQDLDSMKGVQAGGVGNIVVGGVTGVQLGGLFNKVDRGVDGVQAAGLYNQNLDSMTGVQLSGVYNFVGGSMSGVQAAGLINSVKGRTGGVQLAGFGNISNTEMDGVQISTLFNVTRKLKGLQIGLVNIADTADGYMIGLINIVKTGLHEISLSSNEMLPVNLSYKTGSRKMYSILTLGYSPEKNAKAYVLGFGIGKDFAIAKKMAILTELTQNYFYLGNWDKMPIVYRFQAYLRVQLGKKISLFAGPAISLNYPEEMMGSGEYKKILPRAGYSTFPVGQNGSAWIGWSAGINFF
ncbi:peptidase associated/transthyretin-like domain-containing protein [Flavitalea flava]